MSNVRDCIGCSNWLCIIIIVIVMDLPQPSACGAGEAAGMERVRYYLWGNVEGEEVKGCVAPIKNYKVTRMLATGVDESAKFSLWLAHGCISARMIVDEIDRCVPMPTTNHSV